MNWLPNWLTGYDEEAAAAGRKADEQNKAITENLHDRGLISDEDYKVAQGHYSDAAAYDDRAAIDAAALEGLNDGADNIRGGFTTTINTLIATPLRLIPWQVWLAAAIYGAFRLGLFDGLLKGVFKKAR
jgi:hypothetical protein